MRWRCRSRASPNAQVTAPAPSASQDPPPGSGAGGTPLTPSPFRRLAVFALFVVGSIVVASLVTGTVLRFMPVRATSPVVAVVPLTLGLIAAHWLVLRRFHGGAGDYAGLTRQAAAPSRLGQGFVIGALAIGVPSGLLLTVGELHLEPGPPGAASLWMSMLGMLALLVPAALWEELAFRGYFFSGIRDLVGTRGALLVTAAAFGAVHWQNAGATVLSTIAVALAGIFLGFVRLATGSLYAAWMAHLAWNLTMALALRTPVSGFELPMPGYRVVDAGPDWLTGGAWGPEGGAAAMLGMIAASWYLWRRMRREEWTT